MDPNFTPGSDEHEQQLFQEQQDFLYSVIEGFQIFMRSLHKTSANLMHLRMICSSSEKANHVTFSPM